MRRYALLLLWVGILKVAACGADLDLPPITPVSPVGSETPIRQLPLTSGVESSFSSLVHPTATRFGPVFDLAWLDSRETTERFIDDLFDGFLANAAREGVALGLGESFRLTDYDQACLISKVQGNSMVPIIFPGDVAAINRRFPLESIRTNDIVAFISPGFFLGRDFAEVKVVKDKEGRYVRINGLHLVVHQVLRVLSHPKSGAHALETKGVNNPSGCDPFWVEDSKARPTSERFSSAIYLGKVIVVPQATFSVEDN